VHVIFTSAKSSTFLYNDFALGLQSTRLTILTYKWISLNAFRINVESYKLLTEFKEIRASIIRNSVQNQLQKSLQLHIEVTFIPLLNVRLYAKLYYHLTYNEIES
jgi:hypothetical protein